MLFVSTRSDADPCSSAQAIKTGLAPDGGLFVPERFPSLTMEDIRSMQGLPYTQRAQRILSGFLTDFSQDELSACVDAAYDPQKWASKEITPVKRLSDTLSILELWHGPTCAFKDVALQMLPHLLTRSVDKTKDNRTAVILVATSGDTGKAALEGFKDVVGTKIAVFYPQDGVSNIQKLQMTTQQGNNVAVCGINGNFDDAQTGVKRIFNDTDFQQSSHRKGFLLSSANSINWGRLVPQIVYYVSAYCDLLEAKELQAGDKVNFVVPTGNFGDILAGYYAMQMGLPVGKLICASNRNNVLTEFIQTGIYNKNREFYTTTSPSMDILISSNLERFLYHISGRDSAKVKGYMDALSVNGSYQIDGDAKAAMQQVLWGGCCDEAGTRQAILDTFRQYRYVMDPHTAVGMHVYNQYVQQTGDATKTVLLSTASPYKFNRAVLAALQGESALEGKTEFELLDLLAQLSGLAIPNSLSALKEQAIRFAGTIEKEQMRSFVAEQFGM